MVLSRTQSNVGEIIRGKCIRWTNYSSIKQRLKQLFWRQNTNEARNLNFYQGRDLTSQRAHVRKPPIPVIDLEASPGLPPALQLSHFQSEPVYVGQPGIQKLTDVASSPKKEFNEESDYLRHKTFATGKTAPGPPEAKIQTIEEERRQWRQLLLQTAENIDPKFSVEKGATLKHIDPDERTQARTVTPAKRKELHGEPSKDTDRHDASIERSGDDRDMETGPNKTPNRKSGANYDTPLTKRFADNRADWLDRSPAADVPSSRAPVAPMLPVQEGTPKKQSKTTTPPKKKRILSGATADHESDDGRPPEERRTKTRQRNSRSSNKQKLTLKPPRPDLSSLPDAERNREQEQITTDMPLTNDTSPISSAADGLNENDVFDFPGSPTPATAKGKFEQRKQAHHKSASESSKRESSEPHRPNQIGRPNNGRDRLTPASFEVSDRRSNLQQSNETHDVFHVRKPQDDHNGSHSNVERPTFFSLPKHSKDIADPSEMDDEVFQQAVDQGERMLDTFKEPDHPPHKEATVSDDEAFDPSTSGGSRADNTGESRTTANFHRPSQNTATLDPPRTHPEGSISAEHGTRSDQNLFPEGRSTKVHSEQENARKENSPAAQASTLPSTTDQGRSQMPQSKQQDQQSIGTAKPEVRFTIIKERLPKLRKLGWSGSLKDHNVTSLFDEISRLISRTNISRIVFKLIAPSAINEIEVMAGDEKEFRFMKGQFRKDMSRDIKKDVNRDFSKDQIVEFSIELEPDPDPEARGLEMDEVDEKMEIEDDFDF